MDCVVRKSCVVRKTISIKPKEKEVQHFDDNENTPQEQQYCLARDRIMRQIKPPQRYSYVDSVAYAFSVAKNIEKEEPQTYHETITNRESTQWIITMNEEIESLQKNLTWQLVEKPKNQKIVRYKWVFKRDEGISRVRMLGLKHT